MTQSTEGSRSALTEPGIRNTPPVAMVLGKRKEEKIIMLVPRAGVMDRQTPNRQAPGCTDHINLPMVIWNLWEQTLSQVEHNSLERHFPESRPVLGKHMRPG
jgi:hypothetical protein